MKKIRTGSDYSGVGAFDQALKKLGIEQEKMFACDMDKYARQTYIHNYGEPKHYPENVYDREIPKDPLDLFMSSPPCQAFSLAGARKGESEERGVLFYNTHEFIKENKPRYFILENVKGLLSDDNGRTFQRWCAYLGGKSVNGTLQAFPMDEAVPYHIYYKVLNAKDFGVPQNRERIFIVGIRDDEDNNFRFPKEEFLEKKLIDVLEDDVDEKYFLSEKALESLTFEKKGEEVANTTIDDEEVFDKNNSIKIKSAIKSGYEVARDGDSINLQNPNSETRRGRVGNGVAQTLDTGCSQAVILQEGERVPNSNTKIRRLTPRECFRLMDFSEDFDFSVVSDTQAYKQAGNSIVVAVLAGIIKNLNLK